MAAVLNILDSSGYAPFSINCDALSSTFTNGNLLFAHYLWDFGDPGGDYNVVSGVGVAGHEYENSGTYTVSLTTVDISGVSSIATGTVSVCAWDGSTLYVSDSLGTDHPLSGWSESFPLKTYASACGRIRAMAPDYTETKAKILFKCGDSFGTSGEIWTNKLGPIILDRYGTGTNPIIYDLRPASSTGGSYSNLIQITNSKRISARNLILSGSFASSMDWINVNTNDMGGAFGWSFNQDLLTGWAATPRSTGICFKNINATRFPSLVIGTSLPETGGNFSSVLVKSAGINLINVSASHGGEYVAYMELHHAFLAGCRFDTSYKSHCFRLPWSRSVTLYDSIFRWPTTGHTTNREAVKMHGRNSGGLGEWSTTQQGCTSGNWIYNCELEAPAWTMIIGKSDAGADNNVNNIVVDRCKFFSIKNHLFGVGASSFSGLATNINAGVTFRSEAGIPVGSGIYRSNYDGAGNALISYMSGSLPDAVTNKVLFGQQNGSSVVINALNNGNAGTGNWFNETNTNIQLWANNVVIRNSSFEVDSGYPINIDCASATTTVPVDNLYIINCTARTRGRGNGNHGFISLTELAPSRKIQVHNCATSFCNSGGPTIAFYQWSNNLVGSSGAITDSYNYLEQDETYHFQNTSPFPNLTIAQTQALGKAYQCSSNQFFDFLQASTVGTTSVEIGPASKLLRKGIPASGVNFDLSGGLRLGPMTIGAMQREQDYIPSALLATSSSSSQIDLLVERTSSDNEFTFEIERSLAATGPWATVGYIASGGTSGTLNDTGLNSNTTYYYRVRPHTLWGRTIGRSSVVSATTDAGQGGGDATVRVTWTIRGRTGHLP